MRGTIRTKGIVITNRIFETEVAASIRRPVGPFLLYIVDGQYGLATGNIINDNWTWSWSGLRKDAKAPTGLLRDMDIDVTQLPVERGIQQAKSTYTVPPPPESFIDLPADDVDDDEFEESVFSNPWKRGKKPAVATAQAS